MARTKKAGKRSKHSRPKNWHPETKKQDEAAKKGRLFGGTEKILRRNRKTFKRLVSKIGRQVGKDVIDVQLEEKSIELCWCNDSSCGGCERRGH